MNPEDYLELFEERAAIMEFDGGMTREEAERLALADMFERYGFNFHLPDEIAKEIND